MQEEEVRGEVELVEVDLIQQQEVLVVLEVVDKVD
jgi:hypothetical protein